MVKKTPLVIGQKVWLETIHRHGCDVRYEEEPTEMFVIEVNKTNAYIWYNEQGKVRYKVNQKTHETKYSIPDGRLYRLWLSKEEYEQNMENEKERKLLLKQANQKIKGMALDDLRSFVSAK